MRLYNTLTRREEDFAPSRDNQVRMYSCGLTVYARGHIGNFRTFVAVDVLRRALKYQEGFDVQHVMNFTDVDDRTILESNKAGVPLREYTDRYIAAFREDAAALGLETPEQQPRATDSENITAMAETIVALEKRGHTYQSDGSVYFKISTFPEYGRLARLDHSGIKSGARVDSDKYEKDDARDFVLWKASKPGEPSGTPAFGAGRPGWHIECSAMALRLLGAPIDLHAGGVDLIFPHHENEIAQSEGATGQPFARFWMHVEHLMIEEDAGRTRQDVEVARQRLQPLRHRRAGVPAVGAPIPVSRRALPQAAEVLVDGDVAGRGVAQAPDGLPGAAGHAARRAAARSGHEAARGGTRRVPGHIAADLNTAAGIGVMFDLVRALNSSIDSGELSQADAAAIRETFAEFDSVLGVLSLRKQEEEQPPVPIPEIERLIEARREARLARNFAEADRIRKDLDARGIMLEDSGAVTRWKRK